MKNLYLLKFGLLFTVLTLFINQSSYAQFIPDVGPSTNKNFLDVAAPTTKVVYVVGDTAAVFKTNNGGNSWATLPVTGLGSMDTLGIAYFVSKDTGYVAKVNLAQNASELFRTGDGMNFGSVISGVTDSIMTAIHFPHQDTGYVVGQNGYIKKSTDGGLSWQDKSSFAPSNALITDVFFINGLHGFIIDTAGNLHETTNGGDLWNSVSTFITQSSGYIKYSIHFSTPNDGVISGDGVIYRSTDGGANWSAGSVLTPNTITDVQMLNPQFGLAVGGKSGQGEVIWTDNGAVTFTLQYHAFEAFSAVDIVNPHVAYFVGAYGGMHKFARGSISGNVKDKQASNVDGKIHLFRIGQGLGKYDTTMSAVLSSGSFSFDNILSGPYMLLVMPDSNKKYFPTYHGGGLFWHETPNMRIDSALSAINITVKLKPIPPGVGPGFIAGVLKEAGSAKRGPGDPLDGADVSLQKRSDDSIVMNTVTSDSGTFEFSNVPIGQYRLLVDVPGVELDTSMLNNIAISDSDSTYDQIEIEVDSNSINVQVNKTDTTTSSNDVLTVTKTLVEIWPNPAHNTLWIDVDKDISIDEGVFELYDINGAMVAMKEYRRSGNSSSVHFDISSMNSGIYMLRMQIVDTEGASYSSGQKIIVAH